MWRAGVLPGSEGPAAASLPVEADNQVAVCNAKVTVCAGIFARGDVCGRSCSSFLSFALILLGPPAMINTCNLSC